LLPVFGAKLFNDCSLLSIVSGRPRMPAEAPELVTLITARPDGTGEKLRDGLPMDSGYAVWWKAAPTLWHRCVDAILR